jgi:hypothetical protein
MRHSLLRNLSDSAAPPVTTLAALRALPRRARFTGVPVVVEAVNQAFAFNPSSTTTVAAGVIEVPDDIAASTAYGNDPTTAPGRWHNLGAAGAAVDAKPSARLATTAALAANTRTGNVLLANANGALATIDGGTPAVNNYVLVKNEVTGANNGLYVIDSLGGAGSKWQMTRAAEADSDAEVTAGMLVFVSEGTVNGNRTFALTTDDPITLNTTALTFTLQANPADYASTANGKGMSLLGVEDAGGYYTGTDGEAVLQEIGASIAAGLTAVKRTVTVAFNNAALVAANSNGAAATVNIGAVLPANARIAGVDMRALTPFTGGSASAVKVDIGTSGDIDALVAQADVFAAAVDGGPSAMPRGVRPTKMFATGGAQLIATFTPDVGHQLANLTAGSVIIDVWYIVLA